MFEELKRHRGGQPGNQNARKPPHYLTERESTEIAALSAALDEKIAVCRVKIKAALENAPDNAGVIVLAMNKLGSLIQLKYKVEHRYSPAVKQSCLKKLAGTALPPEISLSSLADDFK